MKEQKENTPNPLLENLLTVLPHPFDMVFSETIPDFQMIENGFSKGIGHIDISAITDFPHIPLLTSQNTEGQAGSLSPVFFDVPLPFALNLTLQGIEALQPFTFDETKRHFDLSVGFSNLSNFQEVDFSTTHTPLSDAFQSFISPSPLYV